MLTGGFLDAAELETRDAGVRRHEKGQAVRVPSATTSAIKPEGTASIKSGSHIFEGKQSACISGCKQYMSFMAFGFTETQTTADVQVPIDTHRRQSAFPAFCDGCPIAGQGRIQNWDPVSPLSQRGSVALLGQYRHSACTTSELLEGDRGIQFFWMASKSGSLCRGIHGFAPQKFSGEMRQGKLSWEVL
jgi:hypothetical protein